MAIQYYFNNLDPVTFQRLVNALLNARFREQVRFSPLRGKDGGRDAESAPVPHFEIKAKSAPSLNVGTHLQPGRYYFQVKHHRMADRPAQSVRSVVATDFQTELKSNILPRSPKDRVNYFFLITNVPSSKESIMKIDEIRRELAGDVTDLQADVLWQDHVVSWLDQNPRVWSAFPELFAGMRVPILGEVATDSSSGIGRSLRVAIKAQFLRDSVVRFRQISFEHSLERLFVDLKIQTPGALWWPTFDDAEQQAIFDEPDYSYESTHGVSAMHTLLSEPRKFQRMIVEGGPGQGKSTLTQMLAQVYRSVLLDGTSESRWEILNFRLPLRIELRLFAESLAIGDKSLEQFIAETFSKDAGGAQIKVEDIQALSEQHALLLVCDGLDEVGSDELRDTVIQKITEAIERLKGGPDSALHVIVTSRPPAIAGRMSKLQGFERVRILPLHDDQVTDYVRRWTDATCREDYERERVRNSFAKRKAETHVAALVKNPMQLSVLLHFIRLKGEAFPDRRAELYREYFRTVIDRDVEKSPELRRNRDDIEALHDIIGFEIHSRAESDHAASTLEYGELIGIVQSWLTAQGRRSEVARQLFQIGEERLGLIVALSGEGTHTRYGFDVQPVREYFAASFINDQYEFNAHDVFQEMVRRQFWREVALFLAGLRRANERADLVLRARALDSETTDGWRSEGRSIILQLIQEGVLTSPGHVFQDALAFLLEVVDPLDATPRHEPKGLLGALPGLIHSQQSDGPAQILRSFLKNAQSSVDRYALWRLWRVANRVLPPDESKKYLASAAGGVEITPQIKLLWAAEAGLPACGSLESITIPDDPPQASWAERWFQAAPLSAGVAELDGLPKYHQMLFEQFAFQAFDRSRTLDRKELFRPGNNFAVWAICANLQAIGFYVTHKEKPNFPISFSVDYAGLADESREFIEELIQGSCQTLQAFADSQPFNKALLPFLRAIERHIYDDGLNGWIACRCAVTLLSFLGRSPSQNEEERRSGIPAEASRLSRMASWVRLRRKLPAFFRAMLPRDVTRGGRTIASKILHYDLDRTAPSHIRLKGEWRSVPEMIIRALSSGIAPEQDWISRVPIPHYWIANFLKSDPVLRFLPTIARRRISVYGPRRRLGKRQTSNIVAAVEKSADEAFCAGALFALLGSRFWESGDIGLAAKMISADSKFRDIGSAVFERRHEYDLWTEQSNTLGELAIWIVSGRIAVSAGTRTAAARYLVEYRPVTFPPLKSLLHTGAH